MPTKKSEASESIKSSVGQANNIYIITSSIIVAGLLIAGAVIYDKSYSGSEGQANVKETISGESQVSIQPISENDHIFGDPEAPVKIIEYSDLDCPACSAFNDVVRNDLKEEYIDTGKVAWVYRHFPLTSIHPNSFSKSVASECVAELGGNDSFWEFADALFKEEEASSSKVKDLAISLKIKEKDFSDCIESGKYDDLIKSQSSEMLSAGVNGTPFIIIKNSAGDESYMPGVYPVEYIKQTLNEAIGQ